MNNESLASQVEEIGGTLRESEELFCEVVASVQDYAIFMLSPTGHVVSWNLGAERIKGYRAAEIIGRHFSCFYPPEAIAQGKPEWELRTAVEKGRVEDEGWRVRKDGRRIWANVVITALFDREGFLRGFAKVTKDLTERRKVEELMKADRQKGEFLSMIAHELRNPLAPIRNALDIMGRPNAAAVDVMRARQMAERQVRRMTRILDDLLEMAQANEGKIEARKETIDIASVIDDAVEMIRPSIMERQQQLTVAIARRPLCVRADPVQMEQALGNLLTNASKYTDAGGVIRVEAEEIGEEVAVRVRDTGIGIDAAMLPRIFDLFVQAERRLDRSVGGVGIGLTLVKTLVELQGGTVEALSAGTGEGSEFVVRLPGVDGPPVGDEQQGEGESRSEQVPPLRILVVDDNVDAADSLALLLRLGGQQTRVAYEGTTALSVAREFKPQVVLLDIGLPGMDGYEVARRLRAEPETKHALLVALTGWGQEEDRQRSKDAGFEHHLIKPVEPSALRNLLAHFRTRGFV